MTLATVDGALVGVGGAFALAKASPWRIEMRSILFQRRYANGFSLDQLSSISYCFVRIQAAVIAQW
jgi:hypothetical protein